MMTYINVQYDYDEQGTNMDADEIKEAINDLEGGHDQISGLIADLEGVLEGMS